MEQQTNITISEMYNFLNSIQSQINKAMSLLDSVVSNSEEFIEETKNAEKSVRDFNILDMKSHGSNTQEIVDWYWDNYHYSAILVTTPTGNHPIDFNEWVEGRQKNNKEVSPEFFKDFMIRVINVGGYIQVIPF